MQQSSWQSRLAPWLVAMSILLAAGPAAADLDLHDDSSGGDCGSACAVGAIILVSIPELVFIGVDIGYSVQGEWLGPFWGWTQTLWGIAHVLAGGVAIPVGLLVEDTAVWGWGVVLLTVGTWFTIHGVISLVKHYTGSSRHAALVPERSPWQPAVAVVPSDGGFIGGLAWSF